MNSDLVKKNSLKLYQLREVLEAVLKNELSENVKKDLEKVSKELKKFDADLLKETGVKFSDKEKEQIIKYAHLLK